MAVDGHLLIAGLKVPLFDVADRLSDMAAAMSEFDIRGEAYRGRPENPHLCRKGCSHCCRSGAVFAVSLIEAVAWARAGAILNEKQRSLIRERASTLLQDQLAAFADGQTPVDRPGYRDEASLSRRLTRFNRQQPACPMLFEDLCSIYPARPLLCRGYGFPVDAFAVEGGDAIVFRSLCQLYEGMALRDYVRAKDLKARVNELSLMLGGGHDWGRFTSIEAALACVKLEAAT